MKIGIIGRGEWTFETMQLLDEMGYEITFVVTCKEAPEYKYKSEHFRGFAKKKQIPFINDPKIDRDKLKTILEKNTTDICVSVNYSGIISQEVIDLFPCGILNAHGGDLPRYRGNACQAWAVINREKEIGLCIHKMIGGELDSGDIIEREYMNIDINTRIGQIYDWMQERIPVLMLNAISKIKNNTHYILEKQTKDPKKALRTYPRNPDDGEIDWDKPNKEILRLINASSEPFSGAFCFYENKKMIIWRAELFEDEENYLAVSGQVAKINKDDGSIIVITGDGKIKILSVEYNEEINAPGNFIKSIRKRLK